MCGKNTDCGCSTKPDEELSTETQTITAASDSLPTEWHAVLTVEGLRTTDHRAIAKGALSWRQLPLAIFAQFRNAGHPEAEIVGSITSITRDDATGHIMGQGTFDLEHDAGKQAAQMCRDQTLRWVSVDLEVLESQYIEVGVGSGGDLMDILFGEEVSGDSDWYDEVTLGRIMGVTMVAMPAFPQAVIAPIDMALDVPEPMGTAPVVAEGLMASGIPAVPPASWFKDPVLTEVTPMQVDKDGRVFGHLALWSQCHTGYEGVCIVPPRTSQDYAYFLTGKVETSTGDQVRVGHITYDTGHAGSTLGWSDTTRHYDHTGSVAADVTVGEDEFGIWFAGALRPGLTEDDIRVVRAHALSGDWRQIGGGLELVAALSVPVPGFPIVAAGMKQKEQVSLITAGLKPRDPMMEMARQIAQIKAAVKPLMGLSVERLADRINGPDREMPSPFPPFEAADLELLKERINGMGGEPSQGTAKDKRLKKNKTAVSA